jgi:hypothetical protein
VINVDDGLGKGLRGFLRQIVPDAVLDDPVLIFAREFLGIGTGIRVWCTISIPFKGNGGHGDDRAFGKPPFQIVIFRLAIGQAKPPAVIVDDDLDMIWIVEGRGAAIEGGIIEAPLRRSQLPDELGKVVPVLVVAGTAALRRKIILVPSLELSLWRQWQLADFLVTDQITAHRDERLTALGPECRNDIGGPRSPIKTGKDWLLNPESIHQRGNIDGERRLLAIADRFT